MRADLRTNHRAKKGIAASLTSRRQAGQDLFFAGRTDKLVGRAFDRITTMHTAAWKYEIEGSFSKAIHEEILSRLETANKIK